MLRELSITDFAIIERSSFRLGDGLIALTGETGAGKSILLDALGAVLGARVGPDLIRTGARVARIEALFELESHIATELIPQLDGLGIAIESDHILVLTREIHASGRSVARINGSMVTATILTEIGARLVDIHGQSDHLSLLRASQQRDFLDDYAGLSELRSSVSTAVRNVRELRTRLANLQSGARDHMQRLDLLRYQIAEIEEADPQPGEVQELTRQRDILQNLDRLRLSVADALQNLSGDTTESVGGLDLLRQTETALAQGIAIDPAIAGLSERATELVVLAEDLQRSLRDYLESIDQDPAQLSQIEERLDLLHTLTRKYGGSLEDVLKYQAESQQELETLSGSAFDIDTVQQSVHAAEEDLQGKLGALSQERTKAAAALGPAIEEVIADLRMGSTHLQIHVTQQPDQHGIALNNTPPVAFDETGADDVAFLFAPNRGETLRPLARIASGGETARLTLAIKSILSEVDNTPTLVFDEIDVGVGARSGQVVGERLWQLSRSHQVIVITHLPQIAAYGDEHLRITKTEVDGRTISTVQEVEDDLRIDEIAFMIDGVPATDESRANARVILERVNAVKQSHLKR